MSTTDTYEINLTVTGLCPLILMKGNQTEEGKYEQGAFSLIEHKRHITSLKINDVDAGPWFLEKVELQVFDKTNTERKGDISTLADATRGDLPFSKVADLEIFHNKEQSPDKRKPLKKDFRCLKAYLKFHTGTLFTRKLISEKIGLINDNGSKVSPAYFAEEIGLRIILAKDECAKLILKDQNVEITLKNNNYDIELDNSCPIRSLRCLEKARKNPPETDFTLIYKLLNKVAMRERFKVYYENMTNMDDNTPFSIRPLICVPVVLSQSTETPPDNIQDADEINSGKNLLATKYKSP